MGNTSGYLIIFAVATVTTGVMTPIVRLFARRRGWVAEPGGRKIHTTPTAEVGGIAMFAGVAVALFVAWRMDRFSAYFDGNSETLGVLIAAAIILIVGVVDDVRELSAPARIVGTIVAGLVLVFYGVTMFYFRIPFLDVFQISNDCDSHHHRVVVAGDDPSNQPY